MLLYLWGWPAGEWEYIPYEAVRRMRGLDFILLGEKTPSWLAELPPEVRVRHEGYLNAPPSREEDIEALTRAVCLSAAEETGEGLLLLPETVLPQGRVTRALTAALASGGHGSGGLWPYAPGPSLAALKALMAELRSPWGCPWDREQTHETLGKYLLEEAREAAEAIEEGDLGHLTEELGDVLFQIVFHAQIAAENNSFSWQDVLQGLEAKMIRRHPHVFGAESAATSADVKEIWAAVKQREKIDGVY
ncbi:MAG: hypothetical protein LBL37_05300 [Gracilibacteraceae bacterium]|jgi:NTP pyrophosphatase (non-canonical NTP hydrolase)|nr:hypothetical protein [Gracilibacteraceae bacterium]